MDREKEGNSARQSEGRDRQHPRLQPFDETREIQTGMYDLIDESGYDFYGSWDGKLRMPSSMRRFKERPS